MHKKYLLVVLLAFYTSMASCQDPLKYETVVETMDLSWADPFKVQRSNADKIQPMVNPVSKIHRLGNSGHSNQCAELL